MRDPKRIPEILDLLRQLWEASPDLRYFQLMYNLQRRYSAENNDAGKIVSSEPDGFERTGFDLFNVEDDKVIELLKAELAALKPMTLKLPIKFSHLKWSNLLGFGAIVLGLFADDIHPVLHGLFFVGVGVLVLHTLTMGLLFFNVITLHVKCPNCGFYVDTQVKNSEHSRLSRQSMRYTCRCINCGFRSD